MILSGETLEERRRPLGNKEGSEAKDDAKNQAAGSEYGKQFLARDPGIGRRVVHTTIVARSTAVVGPTVCQGIDSNSN